MVEITYVIKVGKCYVSEFSDDGDPDPYYNIIVHPEVEMAWEFSKGDSNLVELNKYLDGTIYKKTETHSTKLEEVE